MSGVENVDLCTGIILSISFSSGGRNRGWWIEQDIPFAKEQAPLLLDPRTRRVVKTGVKIASASALLPNLADSARLYRRLLGAAKSASIPPDLYGETQRSAAALAPGDEVSKPSTCAAPLA
jgi:hypothetical protein